MRQLTEHLNKTSTFKSKKIFTPGSLSFRYFDVPVVNGCKSFKLYNLGPFFTRTPVSTLPKTYYILKNGYYMWGTWFCRLHGFVSWTMHVNVPENTTISQSLCCYCVPNYWCHFLWFCSSFLNTKRLSMSTLHKDQFQYRLGGVAKLLAYPTCN